MWTNPTTKENDVTTITMTGLVAVDDGARRTVPPIGMMLPLFML